MCRLHCRSGHTYSDGALCCAENPYAAAKQAEIKLKAAKEACIDNLVKLENTSYGAALVLAVQYYSKTFGRSPGAPTPLLEDP